MPVPFIGRLNPTEYVALVGSFLLVGLEAIIRVLTLALPNTLLSLFYAGSRRLFNRWTTPAQKRAQERRKSISTSLRNASDFVELCATYGYVAEEHVVQTSDGYLLGLHRLAWRKGEEDSRVNNGPASIKKRVVYLHHGLLMNSEVWVCLTDPQRCLPFVLVERGFDVWLGNNRGNKYSKKSTKTSPATTEFWNFSIDEFAFYDIPNSIEYILETTRQPSLSYIGFSQGTAQAFATLAVHPKLNDKVNVFIALAPAMSPAGLHNGVVDALTKASPQILFLLFGRRSILASATMWQSILYPPIFVRLIDMGLTFLFNWQTKNISMSQKLAAYPHLYSFTSTKSVVHWFQIIRNKSFQMFDDDVHPPMSTSSKYTKVARYPTRNIKTPIVLVWGGSDSLVDIEVMLRELPKRTIATEIPHYEHLDFLWARDVDTQVFQHVFDALDSFTDAEHTKEEFETYRRARTMSLGASALQKNGHNGSDGMDSDVPSFNGQRTNGSEPVKALPSREDVSPFTVPSDTSPQVSLSIAPTAFPSLESKPHSKALPKDEQGPPSTPDRSAAAAAERSERAGSVTSVDGTLDSSSPAFEAHFEAPSPSPSLATPSNGRFGNRRGSATSNLSVGSSSKKGGGYRGKGGGIRIGTARPVSGIVTGTGTGVAVVSSPSSEEGGRKNRGGGGGAEGADRRSSSVQTRDMRG